MNDEKNNVFVLGLNMEGKSPEVIAREAAMKIIGLTDELIARKNMSDKETKNGVK